MPTVLAATTRALLLEAEQRGLSRSALIRAAGLHEAPLADAEGRVPRDADTALWHEVERRSGDPDFGLRFATSETTVGAFGVVGFLAMASSDLADAIGHAVRFHRIIKDDVDVRVSWRDGGMFLEPGTPPNQPAWSRSIADYAVASYVALGRRWTGVRFRPRVVCFRHPTPRDVAAYEEAFGCPVQFGQPANGILLDDEVLALPLRTAQQDLAAYLRTLAEQAEGRLPAAEVVDSVRVVLHHGLPAGDTGLAYVARRLGMSARTLQRRLEERGVAYQHMVEDVRRAEALRLVSETTLPIEAISERLGYSESKAFRRAFRRWVGRSPAEVRRMTADGSTTRP